jgi:hypothetical protein
MIERASRRFTLFDLLILIGATSCGLGMIKALSPDNEFYTAPYTPIPQPTCLQ